MSNIRSIFLIFLATLMLLTIIGFSFVVPADTRAHPAYGFTPTPRPTDESGGGGDGGGGGLPPPPEDRLASFFKYTIWSTDHR